MTDNLIGLFDDHDTAQSVVRELVAAGISRDRISVVANEGTGEIVNERVDDDGSLAAEGAASGIGSGAIVGGIAGLLIGAGFTVLPIAGFLLAGPVAGLIAGAAAGAATGGVLGGLIGLGIPEEHAELYAEGVRRGGTLVTVQADSADEARVRGILDRDGAVDIESRSADWREGGYSGYDKNAKPYDSAQITDERTRYATPINSDWNDTTDAPAPSADATYTTPSTGYADATSTSDGDDAGYRRHFANANLTGDYERHAPAYRYGRDLANDPTYGSAGWDQNEANYRAQWEARNPGTWDEFKSSIRHAYDSAKDAVTGNNRASLH